jgi:DnaJ-domain-containing protein 1
MIAKDNVLKPAERMFLNRAMARLHLAVHDVDDVRPICDSAEAVARFRELPPEVKGSTLELLIEAAIVDGEVAEEERSLLVDIAGAMGVDRQAIEATLARRLAAR